MSNLEFTGERFVPELEGEIEIEHMNRYTFAREFVSGKDVIDIACGEGYGSELFSRTAKSVLGVDIDKETINHAKKKYVKPNLSFKEGSCLQIPANDQSADILVSFETLEHIVEHDQFMAEVKRVLRPNGILLISTPNTEVYTHDDYKNEFHLKELSEQEFKQLLNKHFQFADFYNQRVGVTSFIVQQEQSGQLSGHFFSKSAKVTPKYLLAIASNQPVGANPRISLYHNENTDILADVHKGYQNYISKREKEFEQNLAFARNNILVKLILKVNRKLFSK